MAKHHPDLVMCRKQPGVAIGRLCEKCKWIAEYWILCRVHSFSASFFLALSLFLTHSSLHLFLSYDFIIFIGDGKCVICDSFVNLTDIVHICDECNYGSFEGRCVVCGNPGVTDAHYCRECVQQEKNRDGCPKVCFVLFCWLL